MIETTIIGNVGSLRFAQAGETQVLNISIATSRKFGERQFTDWVAAKIWGERAVKLAPFIEKGTKLLVRGRPEAKGYRRNDGTIAGELVLHVNQVEFLTGKQKSGETEQLLLDRTESPKATPRRRKKDSE